MKYFCFLYKRPNVDTQAWPAIYHDPALAEKAFGRCSPVVEVNLEEKSDDQTHNRPEDLVLGDS